MIIKKNIMDQDGKQSTYYLLIFLLRSCESTHITHTPIINTKVIYFMVKNSTDFTSVGVGILQFNKHD